MLKHTQEKKQIENNIFLEVDKKFWQVIEKERSLFFLNKKERKGKNMNIEQLREQLTIDEGKVNEIYLDHLGYPTVGIGHLILDSDGEFGAAVGTAITEERCIELFDHDVQSVVADCRILHEGWDEYPNEVQQVIANMMFNMGRTRLSKFKNHNSALRDADWKQAAIEGRDSRWHKQVTNRAERLMQRLETV
jgi:GH24 family phage-related lysozyme (muramidase)|tara:strand:- start:2106 stop:2681 length:576 start_codon:yes stop_codon:yes gene_type:complete